DEQVRAVASRLRCPVCQNESVADSPSELAVQMRALIRERLGRGDSPDAITAYFVSRYGEWILLDPPRRGLGWLLWTAPAAVLAAGLVIAIRFVRRTAKRGESPTL
ncbi:MAG: cytochrome c-type biogenesis protein CcmH, partial [Armatimonadetes bacterium]|nr:cytochrome c-type biogenesis protein CcmH [Armatimonadota bacterium]